MVVRREMIAAVLQRQRKRSSRTARSHVWVWMTLVPAITILAFLCSPPDTARAAFSIQIAPAQIELTLDPGDTVHQKLAVRNHDTQPIDLEITVADFELSAAGVFQPSAPGHTTYSASQWVTFPLAALHLEAGETKQTDYSIVVPGNAEPGGHYTAIMLEGASTPEENDPNGEPLVTLRGRVVAEILITIPGEIRRELLIEALSVPRIAFGAGADYADIMVTNAGNVHLTPNGYVQTWGGLPAAAFDQEFGQFTLLPGASRHFRVALAHQPWLGKVRAKTELQYGPSIGVFDRSVETTVEYFVISWKVIVILDLILIGFDLVLFREWRRRVAARRASPRPDPS